MRVLIWGGGGHGRVVADLVQVCGDEIAGVVDRDPTKLGSVIGPGGARVTESEHEFVQKLDAWIAAIPQIDPDYRVVVAIGGNAARQVAAERAGPLLARARTHPSAVCSASTRIGDGTVVLPLAVVNAGAAIGRAVIVNSGAIVEHDCVLADGVHVSPGAVLSGGVRVGARSWVGAGATVIQGVTIGADAVIGAGAVVIRDVPSGVTVVGNPARVIRRGQSPTAPGS